MARAGTNHKGGRPKGSKSGRTIKADQAREYIIEQVTSELQPIISKAIQQAKEGDQTGRRDLLDRAYCRPKETMEIQGEMKIKLDI